MDDATLIRILETAQDDPAVSRRNRLFVADCLPALRVGTLDPSDRQDLLDIATEFARPHPGDATATGGDLTQHNQSGGINFQQAKIRQMGDPVAGDKIVNQFFGGTPPPNGELLLRTYLARIIENNSDLHLYRMTKRAQSGSGQDVLPPLKLADVYTNVVVDGDDVQVGKGQRERTVAQLRKVTKRLTEQSIDDYPPERVRQLAV